MTEQKKEMALKNPETNTNFPTPVSRGDEGIENDYSHFRYDTHLSEDLSDLESELDFQLQSNPGSFRALDRRRRSPPAPTNTAAATKPADETPSPPTTTPHVNQQQQQQPANGTKPNPAAANVSYLTDQHQSSTSAAPAAPNSAKADGNSTGSSTTAKPSTAPGASASGKAVIVSTPIRASPFAKSRPADVPKETREKEAGTGAPKAEEKLEKPKVKVWANQTMWPNATEGKHPAAPSGEEYPDADFAIDKYPTEVTNKTLKDNNVTKSETDNHQYYNSTFTVDEAIGKKYWIDLDEHPDLQVNNLLSKSHRRAATIKLKFDFPFYGHKVRNITIATGGFLYTGEYVHSWLAATQYIAPLMANFDTTLSSKSFVKYADNGTAFTVEWESVHLQDKPEAGAFTFQVTLLQNGDIIFVYSVIPVLVESIEDKEHPVKIGVSDAYMMDRTVFFARRKTIYEYHRVNFNRQDIKNWTAIYLKALPTCLQMENCNDCLTKIKDFDCKWCPELQKCSTGTFRFRQEWLQKGCDIRNIQEEGKCPARTTIYHEHVDSSIEDPRTEDIPQLTKYNPMITRSSASKQPGENMNMGVSGIIGILFLVSLIAGLGAWVTYAYRNPHSAAGQMLIRYRPSQWSWRRGEARYTAATIHM